jgi:hypothetical protein
MKPLRFWLPAALLILTVLNRVWADPVIYVVDADGQLGTVDIGSPPTGQPTVIGATGAELTGIAFSPDGYTLFGLSADSLYYIYPTSTGTKNPAVASFLGPTGIPGGNALRFGTNGNLYGAGSQSPDLYYIADPFEAAATQFAATSFLSAGGMAFNNGDLYFSSLANQLIQFDFAKSDATAAGSFGPVAITGLVTGDDGVLYGVNGTKVYSINTATGEAAFVLDYSTFYTPDYAGAVLGAAVGTASISEAYPTITSPLTAASQVGRNFNYTITATDTLEFADAFNLPEGLSVNTADGVITGMPTEVGTFNVELYGDTNDGGTADAFLTLTVAQAAVPVVTSATSAKAKTGQFFHYQLAAANSPTSLSASNLPPGLMYYPAEAVISGTPTKVGTYSIALAAANGGGTDTSTLTLNVTAGPPFREVVTLSATVAVVTAESGQEGVFTVTRLGTNRAAALHINYSVEGTAVSGSDYVPIKHFKTLVPGQKMAKIRIHPLGDGGGAGVERVVRLIVEPGQGYIVENPSSSEVKIIGR